jgi:hypothetical protein
MNIRKIAVAVGFVSLGMPLASYADAPAGDFDSLFPLHYSVSRAEVVEDLRDARRLGHISIGEADSDIDTPQAVSTKSRAQVVAELREAQQLGLINVGGEGDIPVATAAQERLIVEAGVNAVGSPRLAAR